MDPHKKSHNLAFLVAKHSIFGQQIWAKKIDGFGETPQP